MLRLRSDETPDSRADGRKNFRDGYLFADLYSGFEFHTSTMPDQRLKSCSLEATSSTRKRMWTKYGRTRFGWHLQMLKVDRKLGTHSVHGKAIALST
jgi:hypothetical protein